MPDQTHPFEAEPDVQLVLDLMDGFRASKAVFTAVSLGVFDRLHESRAACPELAEHLRVQPHALERILGACAGLGLLSLDHGQYSNRPVATRYLRVESPETLAGYILYSDRILYRLWGHLENAVREGTNRWEQEFGQREALFDHFFATEQEKRTFLAGMHGAGLLSSPAAVAAFDLSRFEHLIDLGGGTGHLVIDACRRYPNLRGTIFDLETVIPVSESYLARAGMADRVAAVAGDFFCDPLPEADLFAIARILHDWSEEKIRRLLEKIRRRLPEGGGLLICEKLLNEERDGPVTAYLQSLNMLVCTEGKERSASEYDALLKDAGFREFQSMFTGRPVDVMLAIK